ncbi:RNA-directed DNA polymerase [Vannielia litorea]|nr:RNA-directed DNA polymerase [Vannielia litorea]
MLCFDLANFFPSIRRPRIRGLFRSLGYPQAVSDHLAALCTNVTPSRVQGRLAPPERLLYRSPHLPQGAPTSPALANHAAYKLDRRLAGLARSLGANYGRYADDLSFSGDRAIAAALLRAVPEIVADEGFRLNPAKTRINARTSRQTVTGIVVNQHLNLRRETFDELKAIIHACGKPEDTRLTDAAFQAQLIGRLDWAARLNPPRGRKLKALLAKALDARNP